MDIVFIPGALTTAKFWHHQESGLHHLGQMHHAADFLGQYIPEIAKNIHSNLPQKFTLIALELIKHIPHQIEKLILINSGAKTLSDRGSLERERSSNLINNGKFDFLIQLIFKKSIHD